jgi:hypothetical protein
LIKKSKMTNIWKRREYEIKDDSKTKLIYAADSVLADGIYLPMGALYIVHNFFNDVLWFT